MFRVSVRSLGFHLPPVNRTNNLKRLSVCRYLTAKERTNGLTGIIKRINNLTRTTRLADGLDFERINMSN